MSEENAIVGPLLMEHADAKRNLGLLQEKLLQYRQKFEDFNTSLSSGLCTLDWSAAQNLISDQTYNDLVHLAADISAAESELAPLSDRIRGLGYGHAINS